ncbi:MULTISPECIES: hypothetical protein [Bacillus]|uniref:hypothetical protein n=1 Tax=Bacillus TaxID=1386 RepID=UPI0021E122DF|nr:MULTISPECIES: hypothetical protein [Bacillus]MCV0023505.1 hypothetical protein [Bacillus sp. XT-2]MCV0025792.1 hypothetical protein [Bacillus sp. XT-2]MCY8285225.1 hypothetical protein [Bacillus inaquosorum]MCY9456664.1 hypothetical protein [Bacillus inaquosorum]
MKETSYIPNCPALNFNSPHQLGLMYMGGGLDYFSNFYECKHCGAEIEKRTTGNRSTYAVKEKKE